MQIDHTAADFPYIQLADILRGRINTGTYPPGARLPTITELTGDSGLAVDTIRRALAMLEAEGLVRIVPGRGTFARLGPSTTASGLGRAAGRTTTTRSRYAAVVAAPEMHQFHPFLADHALRPSLAT